MFTGDFVRWRVGHVADVVWRARAGRERLGFGAAWSGTDGKRTAHVDWDSTGRKRWFVRFYLDGALVHEMHTARMDVLARGVAAWCFSKG